MQRSHRWLSRHTYVELETMATEADKGPFLAILEGGLLMKMALFTFSLK